MLAKYPKGCPSEQSNSLKNSRVSHHISNPFWVIGFTLILVGSWLLVLGGIVLYVRYFEATYQGGER